MGYIGHSRSERSLNCINNYELPLAMIKRAVIDDFTTLDERNEILNGMSITFIKFCLEKAGPSSWHHTSSFYNETNHYSLFSLIDFLEDEDVESLQSDFTWLKNEMKREKIEILENMKYAYIEVEIWGGTKKHPTIVGHEKVFGILKGDWLIAVTSSTQKKYKFNSNKVSTSKLFKTFNEMKKFNNKTQQVTPLKKVAFNRMIKNLK